jgi:hypothetical protein
VTALALNTFETFFCIVKLSLNLAFFFGKSMLTTCPLCPDKKMTLSRMSCECGRLHVDGEIHLPPLARLGADDRRLAEELILCSGNLKTLAARFEITYPTLRKRLDGMIERLQTERRRDQEKIDRILSQMEAGELDPEEGIKRIEDIKHGL